jgi:hypothetical protein
VCQLADGWPGMLEGAPGSRPLLAQTWESPFPNPKVVILSVPQSGRVAELGDWKSESEWSSWKRE